MNIFIYSLLVSAVHAKRPYNVGLYMQSGLTAPCVQRTRTAEMPQILETREVWHESVAGHKMQSPEFIL